MLSLIKSKTSSKKQDGARAGKIGNRKKITEVLTKDQLLVNSQGETVLLQSTGGLSFGFTAMEIQRPASVMQNPKEPESRPSSRSSNSSRR